MTTTNRRAPWLQGAIDIMPLAIAVIPWGLLAGSLAIEAGLSPLQAQCLSLLVFAGAAQLAALNLIQLASPVAAILSTTFVVSSRHLLYSALYRPVALSLPRHRRYLMAFLLTDEMFAVIEQYRVKTGKFDYGYAIGAGFAFYLLWNMASLAGILLGLIIGDMTELGFDFAVAALFIAMVVPAINSRPTLVAVLVSGLLMILTQLYAVPNGLVLAAIGGMICAFLTQRYWPANTVTEASA